MANANPSGLGYAVPAGAVRPEPNLKKDEQIIVRYDGKTVKRRTMTNGNVMDTQLFAGDYPNAVHESKLEKPSPKGKAKEGGE